MITVYGAPPTRALRVVWMLEEMGLEYEIRPVDFGKRFEDAEFLAASPAGSIPGIRDGGVQMMESCAILEYLGAKGRPRSLQRSAIPAIPRISLSSILAKRRYPLL
jgi:glutathione S-transferase